MSAPSHSTMRVSLRESRMVLERLVQVARVPEGLVPSIRDAALYSAALGLGGFADVLRHLALIEGCDPTRMRFDEDRRFDADGLHAWIVSEFALDLAVAAARSGRGTGIQVMNVAEASELGIVAAFAWRYGFAATSDPDPSGSISSIRLRPALAADPSPLDLIRRHGLSVAPELWWDLFGRSAAALAADTVESRRHAGPIIVTADGRIVGRKDDDETDLSLLTAGDSRAA